MSFIPCRHALLVFYMKAGLVVEGATTFNNLNGDGDLDNLLNWTNGLPTLANPGTIGGTFSTTYGGTGQVLNSAEVALTMQASMSGGETRLTDSIIRLNDDSTCIWRPNSGSVRRRLASHIAARYCRGNHACPFSRRSRIGAF